MKIDLLKINPIEKNAIIHFQNNIVKVFPDVKIILYGSKARGDDREFSDIDLLILINEEITGEIRKSITDIAFDIELEYDVIFGIMIKNNLFWNSPKAMAMPIHHEIERDGLQL